jgi:UDP-N-acetyl-D-glucosamine dehydrogenase
VSATQSYLHTSPSTILESIEARTARVGVVGLGYVGLPLVLLFSGERFVVTGFDVDQRKVEKLNIGQSHIVRIEAAEINAARENGFSATTDFSRISEMDVVIICVPTPLDEYHQPDLSYIVKTAESLAPHLRPNQTIVLESTTYPGTTEEVLVPILERNNPLGLKAARNGQLLEGAEFFVVFSPEREDPGNETVARYDIPKVIGGVDARGAEIAAALYGTIFRHTVPVSTPAAAEMTKLLENIYRCVNIALVNELKQLCLRMGIDIWEVIEAARTKPFGFQAFYPGPGLGGHCIPIDPFYLSWKAKEFDFRTKFIELAGEVNVNMPYFVVETVIEALSKRGKALHGARVLVLGLAYKKNIDDLRESPSLTIMELLQQRGAKVEYNDPFFPTVGQGRKYTLNMSCTPLEKVPEFDCVLIVTDHSQYDFAKIVAMSQLVVDTRNATRGITSDNVVHC